jgi:hypothetical protein
MSACRGYTQQQERDASVLSSCENTRFSPCVWSSVAVFFSLRPMPKCLGCGLKPSLLAVFYIQDSVHPLSESTFFEDQ